MRSQSSYLARWLVGGVLLLPVGISVAGDAPAPDLATLDYLADWSAEDGRAPTAPDDPVLGLLPATRPAAGPAAAADHFSAGDAHEPPLEKPAPR